MQTSKPKTGSPLQSTRQMLDELDSLMERMLALPVGDAEDLPPLPRDIPVAATVSATLTAPPSSALSGLTTDDEEDLAIEKSFLAEELPKPAPVSPPTSARRDSRARVPRPHFAPESFPETPPVERDTLPAEVSPAPPAVDATPPPVEPAPVPAVRPMTEFTSPPPNPVGRWPLLPLELVNQTFDLCSTLFGPIGSGLRSSRGRSLMGLVGLLCLGLAGVWLVFDHLSGR
jgi:hypothetical protein